jgi:hypothetical protein
MERYTPIPQGYCEEKIGSGMPRTMERLRGFTFHLTSLEFVS